MARSMVAGNWKMNHTLATGREVVRALVKAGAPEAVDVAVFPPLLWLRELLAEARGSHLVLGAQNCHPEDRGAFTGEVSAWMLTEAGCSHVILGHSERRQLFGETDEGVLEKARAALRHGLVPVLCIGESLDEREAGRTFERLAAQLDRGVVPLGAGALSGLLLAYEPVWAIGTGRTATPEQAQEAHAFIRSHLAEELPGADASGLPLLYGGSVKPGNAAELIAQRDVDGFLVGGASLEAESFLAIVGAAERHLRTGGAGD